ncbi:hypothetical protein B0H65DRAFT_547034 [Neurospora tetraspora]|uniref:Uncharacterized protein n=1 Tax=Neurospora tetraspora TaxID=94610 RepID=A0AAE0JMC2_9PEZI|nr:hypothetical protein B0H65DRAFT_547034 [Neurospora tetraspora]
MSFTILSATALLFRGRSSVLFDIAFPNGFGYQPPVRPTVVLDVDVVKRLLGPARYMYWSAFALVSVPDQEMQRAFTAKRRAGREVIGSLAVDVHA